MAEQIEEVLRQFGVLKEGHFRLASGLHSGQYFEKFRILEHPDLVTQFAGRIAETYRDKGVTIVCGPTTGGVIIAFEVARQIKARCVVAEKNEPSGRKIGRGFQFAPEDRILVVDDVLTTGGSVNDTLAALRAFPGTVVGIAVLIDRSATPDDDPSHRVGRVQPPQARGAGHGPGGPFPMPHFAVYRRAVQNFPPDNCPLCAQGIPLVAPGSTKTPKP